MMIRLLHWLMAPLLLFQLVLGFWSGQLATGFERFVWLSRHKSLGMFLLSLLLLRLLWRLSRAMPPFSQSLSIIQIKAATTIHYSLYGCMLLLPLTGWLMASAAKLPPSFFGWFGFPALIDADESLMELFNQFHTALAWLFCGLLAIHFAAAIYHIWVLKDLTLDRILPRKAPFFTSRISNYDPSDNDQK